MHLSQITRDRYSLQEFQENLIFLIYKHQTLKEYSLISFVNMFNNLYCQADIPLTETLIVQDVHNLQIKINFNKTKFAYVITSGSVQFYTNLMED